MNRGHCALPLEKLKLAAMKLLEVQEATVEQALSQMLTGGPLVLEEIDGEPLVFLPHLRRAEEGIAAKIPPGRGRPVDRDRLQITDVPELAVNERWVGLIWAYKSFSLRYSAARSIVSMVEHDQLFPWLNRWYANFAANAVVLDPTCQNLGGNLPDFAGRENRADRCTTFV